MTLSAHKFYGPKGVGALVAQDVAKLSPYLFGGSQERGLRAGTENLPGIAGLGAAAKLALAEMADSAARVAALRDRLRGGPARRLPGRARQRRRRARVPGTLNITVPGIDAVTAVMNLDIAEIAA